MAQASEPSLPGTVELSPVPLDRSRASSPATLALNGSVLTAETLAFLGGYDSGDWSGQLKAVRLNAQGAATDVAWDAAAMLTDPRFTPPAGRTILTASRKASGEVCGMAFEPTSLFDAYEKEGLMWPQPEVSADTWQARVAYLRGVRTLEPEGSLRLRGNVLGAIIHSQAVYVGHPSGRYVNSWPTKIGDISVPAPENEFQSQRYSTFVASNANRLPMLYVAANDGMLHAFRTPAPICKAPDANGQCSTYAKGQDAGKESWAYVPRAAYGNLGNLTDARNFKFQPTVDGTPVTRDVFFSRHGMHEWHSLLVGGLRLGGRGVYALDITKPDTASEAYPARTVLWEFDADAPPGVAETGATYDPADLGYTYGEPAIARLANGRWAVLIPGGYLADCSKADRPARCVEASGTPPGFSPLFVLDAQSGSVIAELKTPPMEGVFSYGLATPVLGDYANDQIDDVAFAGDLSGNLWRFDLSSPNPTNWNASLAYRPSVQGAQAITVMPRLFPDPATNRFIVVFGTGKYLGHGDISNATIQSIYGIRDRVDGKGRPLTVLRDSLQPQALSEKTVTDAVGSATLRTLTSNPVPMQAGGWRIELDAVAGERVIVTPTALFNTNAVLVSTLIPGGDVPTGAIMAIDAATGGARSLLKFGSGSYAGALIESPPASGMLPMAMLPGGGKLILPGIKLKGGKGGLDLPLSLDGPLWRRRSWSLLTPDS
ncbi:pilus assembly protein [Dyella choica]|nr:PilC/PilY family type IV pilus protein [Dyella choica]